MNREILPLIALAGLALGGLGGLAWWLAFCASWGWHVGAIQATV